MIALYEGSEEEEQELHKQFNEGELKRGDCANEFYELSELPKILRELDTHVDILPHALPRQGFRAALIPPRPEAAAQQRGASRRTN